MPQSFKGISLANGYGGLLHLNLPFQINSALLMPVYDGVGNKSSLSVAYDGGGINVSGGITSTGSLSVQGNIQFSTLLVSNTAGLGAMTVYSNTSEYDLKSPNGVIASKVQSPKILFGATDSTYYTEYNSLSNFLAIRTNSSQTTPSMWIGSDGFVNIKNLRTENIETATTTIGAPLRTDVRRHEIPVGSLQMMPLSTNVYGYLPCDGRLCLKSDYPELDVYLNDAFTVSPDGLHFNVPDYRGMFMRVADYNNIGESRTLIDPYAGRAIGSKQNDAVKFHTHGADNLSVVSATEDYNMVSSGGTLKVKATNSQNTVGGAVETRPVNKTIMMFIKY